MLIAARNIFLSSPKAVNNNYITFTAQQENSTIKLTKVSSPNTVYLSYSTDGKKWSDFVVNSTVVTLANVNDVMFLKAKDGYTNSSFAKSTMVYHKFVMTGKIAASGDINALLNSKNVPTSLNSNYCYGRMFYGCSSLTQAPELPATKLADWCYFGMFQDCTSLTQAPSILPATKLTERCYYYMFNGCTALTEAPELPATKLADWCYDEMFKNCTALTQAPELPATTLAKSCYSQMFAYCANLTQAPELPATTLANNCYSNMFFGTKLTQAPALPATTLAEACYRQMFYNCYSLTQAPVLPVTTLATQCYSGMFKNCSRLTTAPALPATTLANSCYFEMFSGCRKLNNINVNFIAWNPTDATQIWFYNVSSSGTFTCPAELPIEYGTSRIPTGWTVVEQDGPVEYWGLKFTAEEAGSTISMTKGASAPEVSLLTSTDGENWTTFESGVTTITLANVGDYVYFKAGEGGNTRFASSYDKVSTNMFSMTGKIAASGNIMSLLNGEEQITELTTTQTFTYLFNGCTSLVSVSSIELPAIILTEGCYEHLFDGCSNIKVAPALPATNLGLYCYNAMFQNCTSLTQAPELPATNLASWCYQFMFNGCTALTSAPELPATTLKGLCYYYMFQNCSNLNSINVNFSAWNPTNATIGWLNFVSSSGTFTCPADLPEEFETNRIPTGWTIVRK